MIFLYSNERLPFVFWKRGPVCPNCSGNILVPLEKQIGRFHCISLRVLSANEA